MPKVLFDGQSLGRLEGVDLRNLIRTAELQLQHRNQLAKEFQNKMDPASSGDIAEEARLLTYRDLSRVVRAAVLKGDYFVVTQETNSKIMMQPNTSKTTMPVRKNGQPAIAVVIAPDDEYPSLADAKKYEATAVCHLLEQTVWDFNAQDYSARKEQIDRYFELRNKKERSYEEDRFLAATIPTGARLDRSRLLLSIRD